MNDASNKLAVPKQVCASKLILSETMSLFMATVFLTELIVFDTAIYRPYER